MMKKVIIIAEAGVNHNGSIKKALKLIRKAAEAGADYIKFQITESSQITKHAKKASYQKENTSGKNSQKDMIKKLEFDWEKIHPILIKECKMNNIKFLTTPFSERAIKITKKIKLDFYKIASGEFNNLPFIENISKLKKKIILSTGLCSFNDIKETLKLLNKLKVKNKDIIIFHCNTAYPTKLEDAHINAIKELKKFNCEIGYSDHTVGFESSLAAITLGAKYIEKHFTLNKKLWGPDHKSSLDPKEFTKFVRYIRNTEKALGNSKKILTNSAKENFLVATRSIVAIKTIKKNERFSKKNIDVKRPGNGISPMKWHQIIGKKSKNNYVYDDLLKKNEL